MIKIEKKSVKNKPFFYLAEQVNIGSKFKKIQVYLGKNIPKDLDDYLSELEKREVALVNEHLPKMYVLDSALDMVGYKKIETIRLHRKYSQFNLSESKRELFLREFAMKFIFESNAIEGSKLSQTEVEKIIKKQYLSKGVDRKEVLEVENSIKAFSLVTSGKFIMNQRSIIGLHKTITDNLGVEQGYKTKEIIVNNKKTTPPGQVRKEMNILLGWWKKNKNKLHPFILAAKFHQRFEIIHPFADGNGRTGRLLFNWMLSTTGYGVILFKNKNRRSYFSALDQADQGRPRKLYRHCLEVYEKTENK